MDPLSFYYYNAQTGESSWERPVAAPAVDALAIASLVTAAQEQAKPEADPKEDRKRKAGEAGSPPPAKQPKPAASSSSSRDKHDKHDKRPPKRVRVFHILKKHKGSSRPSSWREKVITKTKEEATGELETLRDMIMEVSEDGANKEEMRSTFEAVAADESDCSSAKRGGDLGFFGEALQSARSGERAKAGRSAKVWSKPGEGTRPGERAPSNPPPSAPQRTAR
jgi:NIMA-interacting peptidyl-prolyl cis-trans isomerase 1